MSSKVRKATGALLDDLIQLVARSKQQSHDFIERYGVTVPQSGVLRVLHRTGPMPIGTLAEKLYLKTSTVSGIIDRLERDGYVARVRGSTSDRRVVHVELTPKGQEMAGGLPGTSFDKLRRAIERLDPKESQLLLEGLEKLLNLIKEEELNENRES